MLIILDRDGVINYDSDEYIKSVDEWEAIPGSLEAIAQLNRHGFKVVVATNQSGIARGLYGVETLDQIHEKLFYELAAVGGYIEEIFFCPHHPADNCFCRKPKPGLLYHIREKYKINLAEVAFIGDSFADVQAAITAGCEPILVKTGNGIKTISENPALSFVKCFADLAHAVEYVLRKK